MWYEVKEDRVIIRVKAVPNASKNAIVGLHDTALRIRIKAPAVEGAANKELVKFLSKTFKVPKSDIVFVGGETSKQKRISLPLTERLQNFIDEMNKEEG